LLFGESVFDAQRYFENSMRLLGSCESYAEIIGEGVQVEKDWHSWEVILWRITITFPSGEVLEVLEAHEKKTEKRTTKHYRKAKYHFMDPDHKCIFRVDSHKTSIPFDKPCHLHIGEHETVIEDGVSRLRGESLIGIGFPTIFSWVDQYLDGKLLIWQQP